jgi:Protein of unknown function (DUF1631)
MATVGDAASLAYQARRVYTEELVKGLPGLVNFVANWASSPERSTTTTTDAWQLQRIRDLVADMRQRGAAWHQSMVASLQDALHLGVVPTSPSGSNSKPGGKVNLSLVDDVTIEREITTSRLALAIMDRAGSEFNDLRARVALLERREELDANDLLRAHVLARVVVDAWAVSGLPDATLRDVQPVLNEELSTLTQEAYHEANSMLVENRVLAEIDLRPLIRRTRGGAVSGYAGVVNEETRLMTRSGVQAPAASEAADNATAVLQRLNRMIERQVPSFAETTNVGTRTVSPALSQAIGHAQQGVQRRLQAAEGRDPNAPTVSPALLEELQARKQALKRAAETPAERATIEIVALLFQSILTEERIPPALRVWFARLQMPVLRVAVGEPDFFATIDHPARRLIDRMGACVMGFESSAAAIAGALEGEIKRVVQVVEAYPDTGRRVFQTVLTEFERFLENYFKSENEATRKGVSLAQQVEQRETLAIQYTIELRKLLNEVPVQEGVRQFLFQVWADVMAITALRNGAHSDATKATRAAAVDLVWSAGAKVTREERAEVIRKLPPLLKKLRDGMESAGVLESKRDEHIRALNESLAAAFNAKAAAIPPERFEELRERLEALEEMLPEAGDVQLDETLMLDLSGDDSNALEVVGEGGSMPTPAMLSWAKELQVGSWYMLEYGDKTMAVQLAWQGMRRHLSLFVTTTGRCLLFEQNRLASYLQAGLLLPAQEEALTVKATRTALAKIDADPSRLLN